VGTGQIAVTTSGTGSVTIAVSYAAGEGTDVAESFTRSGATSYSIPVSHTFENRCASPWTISASAGGLRDSANTKGDSCSEIG
jgi:serine/threonine-protein kinase